MNARVVIVDPCPTIHLGLRGTFRNTELSVAHAATTVREFNEWIDDNSADLVLCDFVLPDGSSVEVQKIAKRHELAVVLFSDWQNPSFLDRMKKAGAVGLIKKTASLETILEQIRKALQGELLWRRLDSRRLSGAMAAPRLDSKIQFPLTQREFEVLRAISKGQTNKRVAETLQISYETVKEHVRHILIKLNVSDRTQAVLLAVRHGLI